MAKRENISSVFSHNKPIQCVALYARVSTLHGQQDPEMQLSELREYATHRGLSIHEEYVDKGISRKVGDLEMVVEDRPRPAR